MNSQIRSLQPPTTPANNAGVAHELRILADAIEANDRGENARAIVILDSDTHYGVQPFGRFHSVQDQMGVMYQALTRIATNISNED